MALTIGELVGYLDLDDTKWARKVRKAETQLDSVDKRAMQFGEDATKAFAKAAVAVSALHAGTVTLGGAIGIVTSAAGAFGLLPAAGFAAAAGLAAAKVGMQGFGDAMANAGDPEKFAESLKELAPAAQETAIAARDLRDEWSEMGDAVQQNLFADTAGLVQKLGGQYIPVLESGLGGIAEQMNEGARSTASFLAEGEQVKTVRKAFDDTGVTIGNLSDAMKPATSILLDLVAVGSDMLPGLTGGFADAAESAAEFVSEARESGELRDWIQEGLDTLSQLGELLGNIGDIFGAVFDSMDASGTGLLDMLTDITGRMADFLQSAEGSAALDALAAAMAEVSAIARDVLMTALNELAPIVVELAPGFADVAGLLGTVLIPALEIAGPMLLGISGALAANASWLGPLAIGLAGAAKAFQLVTAAVRILSIVSATNPWVVIIAATVALVTLIVTHWDEISSAVGNALDWIVEKAGEASDWLVDLISGAADWIVDMFLNWTLPGLIIQHWDTIVETFEKGVDWVLDAVDWLKSLPSKIGGWVGAAKDWAVRKFLELVGWVRGLPGRILRGLGDLGGLLLNAGTNLVQGLIDGISGMAGAIYDKLVGIVSNAWNGVLDFLGINSPATEGIWAGAMLVEGITGGMVQNVGKIIDAASRLGAAMLPEPPAMGAMAGSGLVPAGAAALGGGLDGGRSLVQIENYHPPADSSPDDVARELDWVSRRGG